MVPSRAIREGTDEVVRERPVRDGAVHGPAVTAERLVWKGCTDAEKTPAVNYAPGDVAAFHIAVTETAFGASCTVIWFSHTLGMAGLK